MRIRRTVKERDIMKVWVFGYDRKLIKSAADSGFRNMSEVLSYANCMAGDKPVDHIGYRTRIVAGVDRILYMVGR